MLHSLAMPGRGKIARGIWIPADRPSVTIGGPTPRGVPDSVRVPSPTAPPRGVKAVAYSPDGRWLAAAGAEYHLPAPPGQILMEAPIRVWDAATGREAATLKGHDSEVTSLAFSPDSTWLAAGGVDSAVLIWDVATGRQLQKLRALRGLVTGIAFSPSGDLLATAGTDGFVRLWDPARGQEVRTFPGAAEDYVRCVAFSPDGRRLTAARDKAVKVWDVAGGQVLHTLKGHLEPVSSLAFSPDGRRLVSGSWDKTVKVWDVADGQELRTLKGYRGRIRHVSFSPDGHTLVVSAMLNPGIGIFEGTLELLDGRPLAPELPVEREALGLLEFLFARPLLKEDVLAAVRDSRTITDAVRARALELADHFHEDPVRFNVASWEVVRLPGQEAGRYAAALRHAEIACRLRPDNGGILNTLGVAQYRAGKYREAVETLQRADKFHTAIFERSIPSDLAFLALAHYRLGNKDEAQKYLARLRASVRDPAWARLVDQPQVFLEEAKAFLREAEEALGDKGPDDKGAQP